jgi:methyltransferase
MWFNIAILALASLQQLVEYYIARRNTRRLLAMGGVEAGGGHHWIMMIFHAVWLVGLWVYALDNPVQWHWLFAYCAIEALRGWVVAALGDRWSSRVIVMPGENYDPSTMLRFLRHPNYLIVLVEVFVLPMVFSMVWYALGFAIACGAILFWRMQTEDVALRNAVPPPAA